MKTCGDGCTPICSSCKYYKCHKPFQGYGNCTHPNFPQVNAFYIDKCDNFHCARSVEDFI